MFLSLLALDRYDSAHKFVIYASSVCIQTLFFGPEGSSFCSLLLLVSTLKLHTPTRLSLPFFPLSWLAVINAPLELNAFSTSLSQRNDASSSSPALSLCHPSASAATLLSLFLLHPHPPTILYTKEMPFYAFQVRRRLCTISHHVFVSFSLCSRICIFTLCLSLYLCILDCAWASRTSSVSAHEVSIPS